jgi:hypothetical protein
VLGQGYTFLPARLERHWQSAESVVNTVLGQGLDKSNLARLILSTYSHSAGIEKGYGFFAPGVPSSYKLVFELYYRDGRIEYELPRVRGEGGGLRLVNVLDQLGQTEYEPMREAILKALSSSVWREHPDVTKIRAVFGYISKPTAEEAAEGKTESYRFLYACDFTFTPEYSPGR